MEAPDVLTRDTWPANTRVVATTVPWDSNYRDVPVFASEQERDEYFSGKALEGDTFRSDKFTYLRPSEPVTLPIPYSKAYAYNYLVVTNPDQPVPNSGPVRTLYYFITSTEYVAPSSTVVTLQLDVMMTYQFDICLGNAFCVSGHAGVSNTNVPKSTSEITGQVLREYLSIDEGIDVGSQYSVVSREWYPLTTKDTDELGRVIVTSTIDLAADPGTVSSPSIKVADGQMADGLPSSCNVYAMLPSVFKQFMEHMRDKSWAAQGVVSVTTFPGALLSKGPDVELFGNTGVMMSFLGESDSITTSTVPYAEVTGVFNKLFQGFPDRGSISSADYLKFLTYPYSVIELTSFTGNSVFLRPELLWGNSISLYAIGCALAPFSRVAIFPDNYNRSLSGEGGSDTFQYVRFADDDVITGKICAGDFLDTALWLADFPQFSIVNNNYITYMASTANTRAYQYKNASWAQDKSLAAAQTAYDIGNYGLANTQESFWSDYNNLASAVYSGGINAIWNGLSSSNMITVPNVFPGTKDFQNISQQWTTIYNPVNAFRDRGEVMGTNWATNPGDNLTGLTPTFNEWDTQRNTLDENKKLADWSAKGDYRNAVMGINAAYQDAELQPPSSLGTLGGQGFMWKNGLVGFAVTYKMCSGAAARNALDLWRRYGYSVKRFLDLGGRALKDMHVMSHFSYWQLQETYLTCASANETERNAIRGVFEKGVTLWRHPDMIGTTDIAANRPSSNIAY